MTIGQYVKSKKKMSINKWIEEIKADKLEQFERQILAVADRENKIIINHKASFLKAINKQGADNMKKILKFWKEEKTFIFMFCFMVFLMVGYVRAINTINELKIENQDLLEMLDYQIPTMEEND